LAVNSFLFRSKEHCLVGLKGDTRIASDHGFIHPNIDTDVIVSEEPDFADTEKPDELLRIVERFCLGRRRLNLFGKKPRDGWLTIGPNLPPSNYDKEVYDGYFIPPMKPLKDHKLTVLSHNTSKLKNLGRYLGSTA